MCVLKSLVSTWYWEWSLGINLSIINICLDNQINENIKFKILVENVVWTIGAMPEEFQLGNTGVPTHSKDTPSRSIWVIFTENNIDDETGLLLC